MTMRQWFDTADEESRKYAVDYMRLTEDEGYVWGTIRTAFAAVSDMCIVPMQDILDLGAEARMNFPGTLSDSNWTWRVKDGMITDELARRVLSLTKLYGRLGDQK
jgi:4-alpha-glucanotransferase